MIRSEKDFLDNLMGAIYVGRQSKASTGYILEKVEEMVRNRLMIYSGKEEPHWDGIITYQEAPKDFKPVEVKGKPLSQTIIEDRR